MWGGRAGVGGSEERKKSARGREAACKGGEERWGREIRAIKVNMWLLQFLTGSWWRRHRERESAREQVEVWTGRHARTQRLKFTCRPGERGRLDPHYAEGVPSPGKMYVSYLQLDKDPAMYPHQNPVTRHPGLSLSPQNFSVPAPPQYPDFASYHHHHHGIGNEQHPAQQAPPAAGGWSPAYPPPPPARDDWSSHPYAPPAASSVTGAVGTTLGFGPTEFPGQPPALIPASLNASAGPLSPGSPRRRTPYEWIRTSAPPSNPSKNPTPVPS